MVVDKQSCLQIVNSRGSCYRYAALDDENNYLGRIARAKGYGTETNRTKHRRRRRRWSLCKTARMYTRTVDGFVSRSPHFSVQHVPTSPRSPRTSPSGLALWNKSINCDNAMILHLYYGTRCRMSRLHVTMENLWLLSCKD